MQKKILKNEKGIALIITLTIITILVTVSVELNRTVRSFVISSAATRDRMALAQMAGSGVHIGIGMLLVDKKKDEKSPIKADSVQDDWANPDKIAEVLAEFPFDDGKLDLTITDELGKIQLNALVKYPEGKEFNMDQKKLWDDIVQLIIPETDSFDEVGSSGVVSCIKDFMDFGDDDLITGLNGAESEYYQGLDSPYSCKNGPFTYLDELVLVKGITPDIYYGTGELFQFPRYITVYGMTKTKENRFTFEGKININTAELPVISALLEQGNEEFAAKLIEYRAETADEHFVNDLSGKDWYKRVPGGGVDASMPEGLITTTSDIYRIESVATKKSIAVTVRAVVERWKDDTTHQWTYKILSWETD